MSLSYAALENALHAWLKSATGLANNQILLADQIGDNGAVQPTGTFLTFRVGDALPLGAFDAQFPNYDASRSAGQEIEFQAQGHREITVSVQAFTDVTGGDSTARTLLGKCQTALSLPTVREALNTAGFTPFDVGAARNVSALRAGGSNFEGRAILEVRFYAVDVMSEFTGYITKANPQGYYTGGATPDSGPPPYYRLKFTDDHTNGITPTFKTSFKISVTYDFWVCVVVNVIPFLTGTHTAHIEWALPNGTIYNVWDFSFNLATNPDGNRVWIPSSYPLAGSDIDNLAIIGVHNFSLKIDGVPITDPDGPLPAPVTMFLHP